MFVISVVEQVVLVDVRAQLPNHQEIDALGDCHRAAAALTKHPSCRPESFGAVVRGRGK